MKQQIIIILGSLILVFVFFIYLNSYYTQFQPDNILYVHTGICPNTPPSQAYCLSSKSLSFPSLISKIDINQAEKEINTWIHEKSMEKSWFKISFSEEYQKFVALATDKISRKEKILVFNETTVFHRTSFNDTFYYFTEKANRTKLQNDLDVLRKMGYTASGDLVLMNLIYHMYNFEHSYFRPWIQTFPKKVDNFFTRMTAYEFKTFIKPNKELYPFVKDYTEYLDKEWKNLEYFFRKKVKTAERDSFFNNQAFTKSDFLYVRHIIETTAWTVGGGSDEIILFPGYNYFIRENSKEDNYDFTIRQTNIRPIDNETVAVEFSSDRTILPKELIKQQFAETRGYISAFIHDKMPSNSYIDCITTDIFYYENVYDAKPKTKDFLKWAAESGVLCLQNNTYGNVRLQLIGDILNMKEEEINECHKHFIHAKTIEEKYNIFVQRCANPDWSGFDPRKVPLKSLNNSRNYYFEYQESVKEYLNLRNYHNKDNRNALLFYQYAEERIKLVDTLIDKIKNLKNPRREMLSAKTKDGKKMENMGFKPFDEELLKAELEAEKAKEKKEL